MNLYKGSYLTLLSHLPSVSLIKGSLSEEQQTRLLTEIYDKYEIKDIDTLKVNILNSESSEDIHIFCTTYPFGLIKLVVIDLDNSSTRMQNTLLRLLETPSSFLKFILFSSTSILSTIESRSQIFYTFEDYDKYKEAKSRVLEALRACILLDKTMLVKSLRYWDEVCHTCLLRWAVEIRSGHSDLFSDAELENTIKLQIFSSSILTTAANLEGSRARIADTYILIALIEKLRG